MTVHPLDQVRTGDLERPSLRTCLGIVPRRQLQGQSFYRNIESFLEDPTSMVLRPSSRSSSRTPPLQLPDPARADHILVGLHRLQPTFEHASASIEQKAGRSCLPSEQKRQASLLPYSPDLNPIE
jgi:hypothetical protein